MKLCDDIVKKIFECVKKGQPIDTACHLCGVTHRTFVNWRTWGEQHYLEGKDDIYVQFYVMLQRGTANFISDNIAIISEAAKKDWKAAAWLLERRCPEWFALKQEVKANVEGVTIKNDLSQPEVKENGDIFKRVDC